MNMYKNQSGLFPFFDNDYAYMSIQEGTHPLAFCKFGNLLNEKNKPRQTRHDTQFYEFGNPIKVPLLVARISLILLI